MKLVCKDCNKSLEECTCIKSTIDFPKQETLEEAGDRELSYINDVCSKNIDFVSGFRIGMLLGAKWQQERSYSEEEVIAFGEFIFKHSLLTHTKGVKSLFEQFKNK
jgi:hypothetical protein